MLPRTKWVEVWTILCSLSLAQAQCVEKLIWGASPFFVWGVSLSRAASMFDRHLFVASKDSATSSARVSHSSSSGWADLKIRPTWLSCSLNCDGFFFVPSLEHVRHCAREGGNCSVVQSLLHVGHCLFIAVANALHHHPFLWVLWLASIHLRVYKLWMLWCLDSTLVVYAHAPMKCHVCNSCFHSRHHICIHMHKNSWHKYYKDHHLHCKTYSRKTVFCLHIDYILHQNMVQKEWTNHTSVYL